MDGDTSKRVTPKARRWPRAIWALISLLAIILLLCGGVWWYASRPEPLVPTGDPLFDRYASTLWDRMNSRKKVFRKIPTYRMLDVVEDWEDEYAADPRYWQLRFLLKFRELSYYDATNVSDKDYASALKAADASPALAAAEALNYDAETRWLVYQFKLAEDRNLHDSVILLSIRDKLESGPQEAFALDMSQAAFEADPDDPRALWHLGLDLVEQGDYEQALVHLRLCNQSDRPYSTWMFPLAEIIPILDKCEYLGDWNLSASLLYLDSSVLPILHHRNQLHETITPEFYLEHPELYQELYQVAYRLALEGTYIEMMVYVSVMEYFSFSAREALGEEITAEQQDTLDRFDAVHSRIGDLVSQNVVNMAARDDKILKWPVIGKKIEEERLEEDDLERIALLNGLIRPLIRLLMEVDFTTLETTPGLVGFEGPYPDE